MDRYSRPDKHLRIICATFVRIPLAIQNCVDHLMSTWLDNISIELNGCIYAPSHLRGVARYGMDLTSCFTTMMESLRDVSLFGLPANSPFVCSKRALRVCGAKKILSSKAEKQSNSPRYRSYVEVGISFQCDIARIKLTTQASRRRRKFTRNSV